LEIIESEDSGYIENYSLFQRNDCNDFSLSTKSVWPG